MQIKFVQGKSFSPNRVVLLYYVNFFCDFHGLELNEVPLYYSKIFTIKLNFMIKVRVWIDG